MCPQPPPCLASGGTVLSRGHWARGCCHISTSEPCHICLGEGAGHTGGAAGTDLAGGLMPLLREAKGGQGSTRGGWVGAADSPTLQGCRGPWGLQTQGTVQGCWAPNPFLSTCSTGQSCQCQGCQGNQISSRGCRAPTARGQPGPAPPGKSLVCPFFPAASGGLQCPAHSQSLAPPPRMTHSSIWSVFTL